MGECGCGATDIEFLLPGPEGVNYGIEVYQGCHYCGTGAAVVVYRQVDKGGVLEDFMEAGVEPTFSIYGGGQLGGDGEFFIPILGPEELVESLKENMDEPLTDVHFGTADLRRTIQDAVHATRSKFAAPNPH